jgi:hypothetical protein
MWRFGIPKVIAKKHLEDPGMVQIIFDFSKSKVEEMLRVMQVEMVFDRYEGKTKNRCVFRETSGMRR